jgi:serine/threonine-protein kinase
LVPIVPAAQEKILDHRRQRLTSSLADRYSVQDELGSGGTAVVFLAKDLKHQRDVAIKVLRPELEDSLGVQRFQREIGIASTSPTPTSCRSMTPVRRMACTIWS